MMAAFDNGNLVVASASRERFDMHLPFGGFVRRVGDPPRVGGEGRRGLVGFRWHEIQRSFRDV
jgi:hypothetical protein